MKTILLSMSALALALAMPSEAAKAQTAYPTASSRITVTGTVPLQCNDGVTVCLPPSTANPVPVAVISGGGGGGGTSGGTATAANPTYTEGATGRALSLDLSGRLRTLSAQSGTWNVGLTGALPAGANTIGTVNVAGTIPVSGTFWQATQPISAASLPLPTGAATSANQATTNSVIGTPGSAVPAAATQVAGAGPSGNLRTLATDTGGRLLPGQGVPTSTRTTLTASTATALEAAGVSGRIIQTVTAEAALTAPIYLCWTQTTSCSATAYDALIPSGATAGTVYTAPLATTARIYAFSTAAQVVVLGSWVAQ